MKARSRSPSELDPDQVNVVAACAPPLRAAYTVEVEVALGIAAEPTPSSPNRAPARGTDRSPATTAACPADAAGSAG
jgi:hypothetical protein